MTGPARDPAVMRAGLEALTAIVGDLAAGESLEERVFRTARGCLDRAGLELSDVDAVVISADDVADGRSITTMLHATAAGSYWRDEIRVTNGSLCALGLAAMRVAAGVSRRVLVVGWWLPTADPAAVALAGFDPGYGRRLVDPGRVAAGYVGGASAACLVGPPSVALLTLDALAVGQADYHGWLGAIGEPAGLVGRLGTQLAARSGDGAELDVIAVAPADPAWSGLVHTLGAAPDARSVAGSGHGHATGLVLLAAVADELAPGERAVVAATGVPPFLQAEAVAVSRRREGA